MTKQQPAVTDWQKAVKPGDIVVDIFPPDKVDNQTMHRVGCAHVMPWRDSILEEFNVPDADPQTHVILRWVGGTEVDDFPRHRNRIDTVLTPREAARMDAAEWPTTLHDFLEVIRTANQ